jgi:transcriptional regulator with XRE-family HTH domain
MPPFYYSSNNKNTSCEFAKDGVIRGMETIGSRLKRLRKAARLTQTALASRVGLTQGAIGNVETGERGYGLSVVDIAKALHVTTAYLLLETDDPSLNATPQEVVKLEPEPELDLQPKMEVMVTGSEPLSPEAEFLGRWFDRLPRDSLKRLQAHQACSQAIIAAMTPDLPPSRTHTQAVSAQRQHA